MSLSVLAATLLVQTTRFHAQLEGAQWWLEGDDGKPFLSLGCCCVDTGTPFLSYDPNNPSYAACQHYPDTATWAGETIDRLQSWGFNTIGAWSDFDNLHKISAQGLYFTPILHMGSGAGAPWKDMWDPKIVALMDQIAKDQIEHIKSDRRVIGYFSDNEMGWWEGALFDWAWKGAGTRSKMLGLLMERYKKDWEALKKDFDPVGAASFQQLSKAGRLYLRPGGSGMRVVQKYISVLSDRYYSLCRSAIKRYDPGALYLGDRYISNFYPEVAESAGHSVDVLSTNLNADWNTGAFARFYLPSLESAAKKPILISEYYFAAAQNRSGNRNDSSGFPVAGTQIARAAGFTKSTTYLFRQPYVVGAHWFQYYDEPKNGRGDGENYDMGLVDVYNEPYAELTKASGADWGSIHSMPVESMPDVSGGVPEALSDANDLSTWPADSYVPSDDPFTRGDLYLFWEKEGLHLAFYWNEDRFGETFYRSGRIPQEDRAVASIEVNGKRFSALIGEGGPPTTTGGASIEFTKTGVRNTTILLIPSTAIGQGSLQSGETIRLKINLSTRARAYRGSWSGTYRLAAGTAN